MMLLILQGMAYAVFVVILVVVLFITAAARGSLSVGCRGLTFALFASPLGPVIPHLVFFGLGTLYYGKNPPQIPADNDPADLAFAVTLLLGPVVCPPAVAVLTYLSYTRRHRTRPLAADDRSSGFLE